MALQLPEARPEGVALAREWVADAAEMVCSPLELDALFVTAERPEEIVGLLLAATRLEVPAVCTVGEGGGFSVALKGLGVSPLDAEPAEAAVEAARAGRPSPDDLVDSFSLSNALRAGFSAGCGAELLVHLMALGREAGVLGFSQMLRVLIPESPVLAVPGSEWFRKHGAAGLLAYLGKDIHQVETVAGKIKDALPPAPPAPGEPGSRLSFVRGRASGTEAVCRRWEEVEISGESRVFFSEADAVRAVNEGRIGDGTFLVVGGCGPRGGPGLLRPERLGKAVAEAGLEVPVLTDGLAPDGVPGTWVSLATPEPVSGGILGHLRDGDELRVDLHENRLRAGVPPDELSSRKSHPGRGPSGSGYTARYARSALTAIEGAGFG